MKFKLLSIALLITFIVTSLGVSPVISASPSQEEINTAEYVEGELIIGFASPKIGEVGASQEIGFQTALGRLGGTVAEEAEDNSFVLARFASDQEAEQAMSELVSSANVAFVERNAIYRAPTAEESLLQERNGLESGPSTEYNPDDPQRFSQWHLNQILYYPAPTPSGTHPCIVLIDSGVNYNHPDLIGKILKGRDVIQSDNLPMDAFGQGTAAAGAIAANTNNTSGISGVSPSTKILAIRVLNGNGVGTASQLATGITWANNNATAAKCGGQAPKIYVINAVGPGSTAVSNAITVAKNKGRLVIGAAGDSNTTAKKYPAAYNGVYAVAGTEQNDRRTHSSNYDTAAAPWIDIAAPGYNIYSSKLDGTYDYYTYMVGQKSVTSSTAMSAAILGAAASRVWAKFPTKTAAQVMNQIIATADTAQGFGRTMKRLDLWGALGNNTKLVLQGQIIDAAAKYTNKAIAGAAVTVKQGGTTICNTTTSKSGYYTCQLPGKNTYTVTASKAGYITGSGSFSVTVRNYTANIYLSPVTGTAASNDWSVVLSWNGWQPYEYGKELDLFVVKDSSTPQCSSPVEGTDPSAVGKVITGYDSYETSQVENIQVYKTYGDTVQIWVSLWDQSPWKTSSFITNSSAVVSIYKNNVRVARVAIPKSPTTSRSDIWYVGNINLNTSAWQLINQIYPDNSSVVPSCLYTFVDP